MAKKVNKGQRLNGNVSATALNYLNRLIGQDKQSLLSKPGGPITSSDEHGLFMQARAHQDLARGEWAWVYRPMWGASDREDQFPFDVAMRTGTPGTPTGYTHTPIAAMATEPVKSGKLGRFQIAGLARTRILMPATPADWPFAAMPGNAMTAHVDSGTPVGSLNENGQMDILWHETYNPSSETEVAAVVRFPGIPRGPRLACHKVRRSGTGSGDMDIHNGNDGVGIWGNSNYIGTIAPFGQKRLYFLRGGNYRVTLNLQLESLTVGSGSDPKIIAAVEYSRTQSSQIYPTGFSVWAPDLVRGVGLIGNSCIGSVTMGATLLSGDYLRVTLQTHVDSATVSGNLVIDGPYDNNNPHASTSFWYGGPS